MTVETECLPFLPTMLSLSITIFMGVIAFVIHLSGDRRPIKASRPKTRSRSAQTDPDVEFKGKKEATSIAKQLKHQKIVACNLEEENEGLNEQVASLKQACNERKAEVALLREQLDEANAHCERLTATLKKQTTEREEISEKKTDTEFHSAMAMLLDLAEQSVNREIQNVSDGKSKKKSKKPLQIQTDGFSPEDWTFMMSVAGFSDDRRKEFGDADVKAIARQQFEIPTPMLLFNEPSPTSPCDDDKASRLLAAECDALKDSVMDGAEGATSSVDGLSLQKTETAESLPTLEENLSPDPNEDKELQGRRPAKLDGLNLEDLNTTQSWGSQCTTPIFCESESSFNPNAKPFIPKRQQLQAEIQKRLQQWKDFYYTQVQPQEVAAQPPTPFNWAEGGSAPRYSPGNSRRPRSHRGTPPPAGGWGEQAMYPQYYPQELEWDQATQMQEGSYGSFLSQTDTWESTPHHSELITEETWPQQPQETTPAAPADGVWTSHQPYSCHCQCTSCNSQISYAASATSEEPSSERRSSIVFAEEWLGKHFTNANIGLTFRFPSLMKKGQSGAVPWTLAHEATTPFYLARFTPASGSACQIVITEENLQAQHTLESYVELSKRQTERTLAAYNLVFQSERQVRICGCEAIEVVYMQEAAGDMLVWSLCIHTNGRVITLQIVAANGTRFTIMQSLQPMMESILLLESCAEPCMTIQRATRCWLARKLVAQTRRRQQREDLEENAFIRVTARINPRFSK